MNQSSQRPASDRIANPENQSSTGAAPAASRPTPPAGPAPQFAGMPQAGQNPAATPQTQTAPPQAAPPSGAPQAQGQAPVQGQAPAQPQAHAPAQPAPASAPAPQSVPQPAVTQHAPAQPQAQPQPQPAPQVPPAGRLTPADPATAAAVAAAQARAAAAGAPGQAPAPAQGPRPVAAVAVPGVPVPAAAGGAPALRPAGPLPAAMGNFPPAAPVRQPVGFARPRRRHWLALLTLVLFVIVPTGVWGWYLWTRAVDQYTSTTQFSVRREEGGGSIDIFGGLSALGGTSGTATDTDILFEVIRSPDMVRRVSDQMDLVGAFTRAWPRDFVFAYDPSGAQEDLTDYWNRQVKVLLDTNAGIITVRSSAFTPDDALRVSQAVLSESEKIVNALSDKALQDATSLAERQLFKTRDELLTARQEMTAFRIRTRILDPSADLGTQMEILANLQGALTQQQVALDQLRVNARAGDQRIIQAEQKIEALNRQIEEERSKFSGDTPEGESYATLMQEYEKLAVDLQFAESANTASRVAYEGALQNAQRQSRYLAAHIQPTAAQKSLTPDRPWLLALGFGLTFVLWSIAMLVYYSIRDRR